MIIGKLTGEFDRDRARLVLAYRNPFDETTQLDDAPSGPDTARGSRTGGSPAVAGADA